MSSPTSMPTNVDDDTSSYGIEVALGAFLIIGVICGNFTEYLFEKVPFPIPFHVLLFFEGIIVAIILEYGINAGQGAFENVLSTPNVAADLVVFIFLPALLYGECMNMNWHHVTSGFSQYMLLAGPGALVGGSLTAVFCYFALPYSWSWQVSFLFGAILSATDPVSVIAVLKSTGASSKLTTIIVGESLFNDGSAMVLFFLFYRASLYLSSAGAFIAFIFEMVLGSPAIGLIIGIISHKLMRYFDNPTNPHIDIQIAITISAAYISFYIAEGPCQVSGVLSACTAGLVIAYLGSPKLLDNDKLHAVWGNLEWTCNTLIFFLAGLLAGTRAIEDSNGTIRQNIASVIIVYIAVMAIRCIMIAMLYPFLKDIGFKMSVNEAIFAAFSGLRGALGLSLSLIVQSNFTSGAENFFTVFAGFAALSLLINGSLAKVVIKYLKLIDDPNAPKSQELMLVLRQIKKGMNIKLMAELQSMKDELGDYDILEVNKYISSMRKSIDFGEVCPLHDGNEGRASTVTPSEISLDLLSYVREIFLDTLRARYWDSIRSGKLGTHAYTAKLLLYSLDVAQDYTHDISVGLQDWNCIVKGLAMNEYYLIFLRCIDDFFHVFGVTSGFEGYAAAKRERMAIYTLLNFIDAHKFAQSKLHEFLGGIDGEINGPGCLEEAAVRKDSMGLIEQAEVMLSKIPIDDVKRFCTNRAARVVILKQLEIVEKLVKEGALSDIRAKIVFSSINDDIDLLDKERATVHKSFLESATKRKVAEGVEFRNSFRDSFRSSFRESVVETVKSPVIDRGSMYGMSMSGTEMVATMTLPADQIEIHDEEFDEV